MTIRAMQQGDCTTVVDIHLRSFKGFFLSFLGSRFLEELYLGILADSSGIAFVYEEAGHTLGFVAGTQQPANFYRRLLRRRWWRFGMASLPAVIRNPLCLPRLFRALSMPRQVTSAPFRGTLMSIATLPGEQNKGLGSKLVFTFLEEAKRRGLRQVDLTTDKENNDLVNNFYLRQGFSLARSFVTPEGREMNEYIIDLQTK